MILYKIFHLLIKYYLFFTITECQTTILTDVTDENINLSNKTTKRDLPKKRFDVSDNQESQKKLQIEFNEVGNTIKNDLRKSIINGKAKRSTTAEDSPNSIVKKLDENSKSLLKALLKIQNGSRPVQPTPRKLSKKPHFVTTKLRNPSPTKGTKSSSNASNLENDLIQPLTAKVHSAKTTSKSFHKVKHFVLSVEKTTTKPVLREKDRPQPRVKNKFESLEVHQVRSPLLPKAEILDMAPAKGDRVSNMRNRGRLCHRHVLLPEGPKYDHAGRAYMDSHRAMLAKILKPFEQTHKPHFMLPSCCNCCKKSVLGCE